MTDRMRFFLLALLLLHPAASKASERLRYAVYAAGFNILTIDATADIADQGYRIDLAYSTVGVLGTFFPSTIQSFVHGSWTDTGPLPTRFASWGTARGRNRRTVLDFVARQPVVVELEPAVEEDRETVPRGVERDSIDTLSGMAYVVRAFARSGSCDGNAKLFDGRRVLEVRARPAGLETLAPDFRSTFSGPAFRCDFEGRQTAGFLKEMSEADRNKLHLNRAWFASLRPGAIAMPVRVDFEARFIGAATAYLNQAAK